MKRFYLHDFFNFKNKIIEAGYELFDATRRSDAIEVTLKIISPTKYEK